MPVRQRIEYTRLQLVHQSLAGQTPTYIADDIQLATVSARVIAVSYVQPLQGHASFHGRTTWAIEALVLQAPVCGTVYRRICDDT